jgi:serine protease Do
VIAINAAILPEFGGSNLGVPVAKLVALIAEHAGGPKVEQEEN